MSREKAQQAITDINRIAGTAGEHLDQEEWMGLAVTFNRIEEIGHHGFNLAYNLQFTEPSKPEESPRSTGDIRSLQGATLETTEDSPPIQYAAQRSAWVASPTRPAGCTPGCQHDNGAPKSYLVTPHDGAHFRISFSEEIPEEWEVENWYQDGHHTGRANRFKIIRFMSGCRYKPCTDCHEDIGEVCLCGYRDPEDS